MSDQVGHFGSHPDVRYLTEKLNRKLDECETWERSYIKASKERNHLLELLREGYRAGCFAGALKEKVTKVLLGETK